uniref:Uncharacterized protein n=1 Tax=Timema monikensis TaxID=170555 RepID=A0A7R9ELB6_9NEOP|nr:unnamed protein product [Timema monikensis]
MSEVVPYSKSPARLETSVMLGWISRPLQECRLATELVNTSILTLLYLIAFIVQLSVWSPYYRISWRDSNMAAGAGYPVRRELTPPLSFTHWLDRHRGTTSLPPIQGGNRSHLLPLTEATLRSQLFPVSLKQLTVRRVRPGPTSPEPQEPGPESPNPTLCQRHHSLVVKYTAPQSPTHFWAATSIKAPDVGFRPSPVTTTSACTYELTAHLHLPGRVPVGLGQDPSAIDTSVPDRNRVLMMTYLIITIHPSHSQPTKLEAKWPDSIPSLLVFGLFNFLVYAAGVYFLFVEWKRSGTN